MILTSDAKNILAMTKGLFSFDTWIQGSHKKIQ